MCAIAGFWLPTPGPDQQSLQAMAAQMAAALAHRGPDAEGSWADAAAGIALGHQRLSIQDLSEAGAQPMLCANERFVLSFNGELYNFRALQQELRSAGHHFVGHSDTEVMLKAFTHWGVDLALTRFNGMFALSLWDRQERCLVLARDRAGKKPLYFGYCAGTLLFASELKALRRHPDFNAEICREALAQYLKYSWVPAPGTIYRDIQKLAPGHRVRLHADGQQDVLCYWSAAQAAADGEQHPFQGDLTAAADALEPLIADAVSLRMVADVPLGALLSGGYDSALVTALMRAGSDTAVQTFTIGFDDPAYDESDHARAIANHLGTDHTELIVAANDAIDVIPDLPQLYDEPFADASQVPTYLLAKLARAQVTVALSGDGGDELFAGYGRYRRPAKNLRRIARLPGQMRPALATALEQTARMGWRLLGPRGEQAAALPAWRRLPDGLEKQALVLRAGGELDLFAQQRARVADPASLVTGVESTLAELGSLEAAAQLEDPVQGMMLLDFCNYLVDDILVKVDRASMGVGLEIRSPLLDYRVVEKAWSLPVALRQNSKSGKLVLREILARHVPRELTDRPKRGFGIPVGQWLRGPLREWAEHLLDPRALRESGYLNEGEVTRLWRQHLSRWQDHSDVLWSILMFLAWLEKQ